MKEGATFFVIAAFFLVLFYGYVESQGGFGSQASHLTASAASACNPCNYHQVARQDAIDNHIDPDLFERQINQESGFNPNAQSVMGAIGIAQIMPSTAKGWNVNPWNATDSLSAAAKAMAWYQNQYNGDYSKALSAYNYGYVRTNIALSNCGDNWKGCVPVETRNYISAVMGA
jgi:soluble lytic murein transglycosylase-like protein